MISVDDRAGSIDLVPMLRGLGLPVFLTRMQYGDVSFMGNGPKGVPIPVGIEVKSLKDVITCMTDGRFSGHQLPGLIQSYQQPWLLMVGAYRPSTGLGKQGILEYRKARGQWSEVQLGTRRFMWKDLETWLFTVQVKAGLSIRRCSDWAEATQWIGTLYRWWTGKEYEEHRGHLALHDPTNSELVDRAILIRPSLCRMVAAQLPGIGVAKSAAVASRFGSTYAAVTGDICEWEEIAGVGRTMAKKIYTAIREER